MKIRLKRIRKGHWTARIERGALYCGSNGGLKHCLGVFKLENIRSVFFAR